MNYYSTRREAPAVGFEEALLNGLAPDGGLYYPSSIPQFSAEELARLEGLRQLTDLHDEEAAQRFLQIIGFELLQKWFGDEIEQQALEEIAIGAQSFPMPIRSVGDFQILELFHGPTMAFKDVAARNLARLMNYFLERRGERAMLLVATSGDTGGAIAHGFAGQENIEVVVLFPKGKVSRLQEEQLTRVADNITSIEVDGVFDDCQAMVKQAFVHPKLRDLPLTSANSINVARLIPQAIYYLYTHCVLGSNELELIVPSGNFGNLTAGLFAREMGVPFASFIAAINENDAAARYYDSGEYAPNTTVQTLSNAMDVGNPSNFARVLELFGHQHERFRNNLTVHSINNKQTAETIQEVYHEHGYLLCPHSAVGWAVAAKHRTAALQPVIIATASPAKFAREIYHATGIEVDDKAEIEPLLKRPKRKISIQNRWEALEEILLTLAKKM